MTGCLAGVTMGWEESLCSSTFLLLAWGSAGTSPRMGEPSLLGHSGVFSPLEGEDSRPRWIGETGALLEPKGEP
ncbi:hypothetical protein NHX12_017608 [Muraenolepis orangiensis]|uniref:Uncharacterized protein n=1 Tax=Muraenolepis orangiensis TaxID=630683 RepID=A0A9Q0EV32_9TELE|nr:hypothetical protein NHX12_017608 [Muraenolepis orangiensis]